MTRKEIENLVREYHIQELPGGRLGFKKPGFTQDEFEMLKAAKAEILAYFRELEKERQKEEKKKEEERERRKRVFESIEGVSELRKLRRAWNDYYDKFEVAMERGDGIMPTPPRMHEKEIIDKFPSAAFALKVENEALRWENSELRSIARRAYDALCEGKSVDEVEREYKKNNDDFVKRHIWD